METTIPVNNLFIGYLGGFNDYLTLKYRDKISESTSDITSSKYKKENLWKQYMRFMGLTCASFGQCVI